MYTLQLCIIKLHSSEKMSFSHEEVFHMTDRHKQKN